MNALVIYLNLLIGLKSCVTNAKVTLKNKFENKKIECRLKSSQLNYNIIVASQFQFDEKMLYADLRSVL